jgi:hypothetical protein
MSVLVNPGSEPIIHGNTVELVCDFLDDALTGAEEPTAVELVLTGPKGAAVIDAKPSKQKAGVWAFSFLSLADHIGRWDFYWKGDGVAATEGTFVIS